MPTETISPEVECLKLKAAINENHRLAQKAAGDAIERALLAGELIAKWRELLPKGKFERFVEKHFEGSLRTAQVYMQASKGLSSLPKAQRTALLGTEDSLSGLIARLKKDDSGPKVKIVKGGTIAGGSSDLWGSDSISDKGKPGGDSTSLDNSPASTGPASEEAADSSGEEAETGTETTDEPKESGPRPPRSGKEKPGKVDYGKCPNCAGTKWTVHTIQCGGIEGVKWEQVHSVFCAKCKHPHGEPVGDRPENVDPAETLRSKTVKTAESLMRCVDDLHLLIPKAGTHKQTIELCKSILKTVKNWK